MFKLIFILLTLCVSNSVQAALFPSASTHDTKIIVEKEVQNIEFKKKLKSDENSLKKILENQLKNAAEASFYLAKIKVLQLDYSAAKTTLLPTTCAKRG